MLTSYFRDGTRVAALPVSPVPMTKAIAGTILASHGSAAGLDGRPYEIYHHGVAFTTFLVGHAFHAAALGRTSCVEVLGPNGDLSVWIPKKEGADTPAGQRPLQLPITLRKIFGAAHGHYRPRHRAHALRASGRQAWGLLRSQHRDRIPTP